MINKDLKIAFFGNSWFSALTLSAMKANGLVPSLIVTTPDRPKGRKLVLTKTETKVWAEENGVPFVEQEKIRDEAFQATLQGFDLFIVASYGKIVPDSLLAIPKYGTLNLHPSLLPKYRGASPLQSQILADDKEVGITIMLMDREVDHGDILAQQKVEVPNWPPKTSELKVLTADVGGTLLVQTIDGWVAGTIKAVPQNHAQATFCTKFEKADGLMDIVNGDPYQNYLKIQAFDIWPGTYFMVKRGEIEQKVIVKEAKFENGTLQILRVLPEGKKEMSYKDFLNGLR